MVLQLNCKPNNQTLFLLLLRAQIAVILLPKSVASHRFPSFRVWTLYKEEIALLRYYRRSGNFRR